MPTNPTPLKPRLAGLDLLRLLAVVLVLGRHLPAIPDAWPDVGRRLLITWTTGGWVGVDLFFVLSGFLVSGLLFSEYRLQGRLGVGRFYLRRGWKIYPPFFLLIAVTVLIAWRQGSPLHPRPIASELLFLQSYVPGLWNHTWSLAVEEHFYLLLPLALAAMLRWNRRSPEPLRPILQVAAGVAVLALACRVGNWYLRPSYTNLTHLFASHLRLDSLFFGVAISYVYHFHQEAFVRVFHQWRRGLLLGGALLLSPAFMYPLEETPLIYTAGLTLFYVGSGMMVVGVLLSQIPEGRAVTALAGLGRHSYSIYLWHMFIVVWAFPLIEGTLDVVLSSEARLGWYLAGSFGLGLLMAKGVEVPMLRIRDRWFPSRGPSAVRVS